MPGVKPPPQLYRVEGMMDGLRRVRWCVGLVGAEEYAKWIRDRDGVVFSISLYKLDHTCPEKEDTV